ncbi:MAG TPA: hypothetical protein VHJ57_00930, partial [Nitrososphaeraceae archaeon]|nr:hypothetical protein [Nitrososphaeraceae archaeon]
MLSSEIQSPKIESIKSFDIADIAIMSQLAYSFKDEFQKYFKVDSFTSPDPFNNEDGNIYLVIVDRENIDRIISMIIIRNDSYNSIPLEKIMNDRLKIIQISKEKALSLKNEMMPKDTNNFYQFRKEDGRVIGYIMFAFQI